MVEAAGQQNLEGRRLAIPVLNSGLVLHPKQLFESSPPLLEVKLELIFRIGS